MFLAGLDVVLPLFAGLVVLPSAAASSLVEAIEIAPETQQPALLGLHAASESLEAAGGVFMSIVDAAGGASALHAVADVGVVVDGMAHGSIALRAARRLCPKPLPFIESRYKPSMRMPVFFMLGTSLPWG